MSIYKSRLIMEITKKRSYNSTSRQTQAQVTKDRILSAAKKLFESKGFEKTTIEEIAQDAEVSMPTIYALFQSKSGILRILMDSAFNPKDHEALVKRVNREESPAERLKLTAKIARQLYDAEKTELWFLQSASILDPEFKKIEIERENRRYFRQEESFNVIAQKKVLTENLSTKQARDIIWALTGRDLYRMLVLERGWSSNDYEKWLGNMLAQILLKQCDN